MGLFFASPSAHSVWRFSEGDNRSINGRKTECCWWIPLDLCHYSLLQQLLLWCSTQEDCISTLFQFLSSFETILLFLLFYSHIIPPATSYRPTKIKHVPLDSGATTVFRGRWHSKGVQLINSFSMTLISPFYISSPK